MAYVTKEKIKELTVPELNLADAVQAATVDALCSAVSALIDRFTNRPAGWFEPVADPPVATARKFRGEGKNYLRIPRHVGTVVFSPTIAAGSVYENASGWIVFNDQFSNDQAPEYRPTDDCGFFVQGQIYIVTAAWGFAATPTDIELAAALIVGHIWDRGKGVIGQVTPSGFVIERDMPPTAKLILAGWVRKQGEIV